MCTGPPSAGWGHDAVTKGLLGTDQDHVWPPAIRIAIFFWPISVTVNSVLRVQQERPLGEWSDNLVPPARGLPSITESVGLVLTDDRRRHRLAWARAKRNWSALEWSTMLFTDESWVPHKPIPKHNCDSFVNQNIIFKLLSYKSLNCCLQPAICSLTDLICWHTSSAWSKWSVLTLSQSKSRAANPALVILEDFGISLKMSNQRYREKKWHPAQ